MTDITELAQREKFEAWWESEYKHLESSKYTDAVPHIKYGFWMAYQAGGAELVEEVEKAQGMETYWKTQCRGITDHCEELQARIAELESHTVKPPVHPTVASENLDDETLQELIEFRRTTFEYHSKEGNKVQTIIHGVTLAALRELQERRKADSEPVEMPIDYLQGHKDGLEWAAQLAEANHPETGDWLYDDPIELAKAIRKGPDMPPVQPVADSEPDRNPVLAYADSYRDMAKQGVESVPIWSVITDLERNIAPLYRHAQPVKVTNSRPDGWYMWPDGDYYEGFYLAYDPGKSKGPDANGQCWLSKPLYDTPQMPPEMTPEMMRAVQLNSEIGAYAASNLSGAYDLFAEFWKVACRAAMLSGGKP